MGRRQEDQPIASYLRDVRAARDNSFRFRWERAIRSDSDLKSTTRLVLFVMGTYMDNDGTNLRTSLETVAKGAAISRRAAGEHIGIAVAEGWLELLERGRKVGTGANAWGKASEYLATIPDPSECDPDASEDDPPSRSETTEDDAPMSECDPDAPECDPDAPEGDGGSHYQRPTGFRPAAAAEALSERDLEIRRRIREFEKRTGEVAGPGMRKRIADDVDVDLAADALLKDAPGASRIDSMIRAAEQYGTRFARVWSRQEFEDDLGNQRDWIGHPEVLAAARRAYEMNKQVVC